MRIQHNIAAMNSYRNLNINQNNTSKNLEKLSSGYRINRAGDDAAGLAISEKMRSQINGLNQAASNANDAIGLIQTAEGALTETHSMLQRMKTLATQASNGTYETVSLTNIKKEYDELKTEITRISNSTKFNGITLFAAGAKKIQFQIGDLSKDKIEIDVSDMTATGNKLNLTNTITTGDTTANVKLMKEIDNAIDKVSDHRAHLGAAQNRLEHTVNNLEVTSENISAAESRIRDTDMADEMTKFTKNNILMQAAQSMLTQSNAQPQNVLSMLQ